MRRKKVKKPMPQWVQDKLASNPVILTPREMWKERISSLQNQSVRFAYIRVPDGFKTVSTIKLSTTKKLLNQIMIKRAVGVVVALQTDDEQIRVGWSFCSKNETFSKEQGRLKAIERALDDSEDGKALRGELGYPETKLFKNLRKTIEGAMCRVGVSFANGDIS